MKIIFFCPNLKTNTALINSWSEPIWIIMNLSPLFNSLPRLIHHSITFLLFGIYKCMTSLICINNWIVLFPQIFSSFCLISYSLLFFVKSNNPLSKCILDRNIWSFHNVTYVYCKIIHCFLFFLIHIYKSYQCWKAVCNDGSVICMQS